MKIGFIQGRLSPIIDGRIQAFPWKYWQEEFVHANELGINMMEWTLDHEDLAKNPFITSEGQREVRQLSEKYNVKVVSLTGDCFMHAPFYKYEGTKKEELIQEYITVLKACDALDVEFVVVPLVDNGSLESVEQEDQFIEDILKIHNENDFKVKVVFESDYAPKELAHFIDRLPAQFGINYDSGNSAALGYDPTEELRAYGKRVYNVHIKDRVLGGTTVALGTGNTDFAKVFKGLKEAGYHGNYILQTARAEDGTHNETLARYKKFVEDYLNGENH